VSCLQVQPVRTREARLARVLAAPTRGAQLESTNEAASRQYT
jgi:hypothetical protein